METEEKRSFLSPAHTEKKPVAEPAELTQCVHTDFAHCQGTEEKKKWKNDIKSCFSSASGQVQVIA